MAAKNIILAGVGGQGILTCAKIICAAADMEDRTVKQTEVHGMSQRGGGVETHIRISNGPIYSPLIPAGYCDLLIATEPIEALRQSRYLAAGAKVVTSLVPFKNIPNYPPEDSIRLELAKLGKTLQVTLHTISPEDLANEPGGTHAQNAALLGTAVSFTGLKLESFQAAVKLVLSPKSETAAEAFAESLTRFAGKMYKGKNPERISNV